MDIMRSFHESPLATHLGVKKKKILSSKNIPIQPLEPFHTIAMDIVGPLTKTI